MPHFVLHHSTNLPDFDASGALTAVNAALVQSGHFDEIDIKSRAFRAQDYRVGMQPEGRAFVAGTLSILTGRSPQIRQELGQLALQALTACVTATAGLHVQVSVEVVEIQRESYAKAVVGG